MSKKITKLIVPLAGFGTRFLPSSSAYPKELTHLVDKPVLQYIVEEAYASGITEIIFIISSRKKSIAQYFSKKFHDEYLSSAFKDRNLAPKDHLVFTDLITRIKFRFIEKNSTLGDGHSILFAKKFIKPNEAFAVSMGDLLGFHEVPFLKQLIDIYNKKNAPIISVEEVPLEATSRFGVIAIKKSIGRLHLVSDIIEKPGPKLAPSRFIMTGKYVLTPKIFNYLETMLKNHKSGEIKLADALKEYSHDNDLYAYQCLGSIQDTGNKLDFLKATVVFGLNNPLFGKEFKKFIKSIK